MNKQRKVLITITYNEMGVIIDTKTVELGSSAQPEPCEDTISRQAAMELLITALCDGWDLDYAEERVQSLPPTSPDMSGYSRRLWKAAYERGKAEGQRTGKWIPQDHNKRVGNISTCVYYYPICSNCGKVGNETYKYCPHCGAKMEGAKNESD